MKVLFDHQAFSYQDFGGVSKYYFELMRNFDRETKAEIALKFSNNEFASELGLKATPFFARKNFIGKRFIMNLLNKICLAPVIRTGNYDLLHATYFDPYFINLTSKPKVITVHDLTFDIFPQYFKSYDFSKYSNKAKCLEAADAIIAVSENTKKDIVRYYHIPEEKIHVVYHGVNKLEKIEISNDGIPGKFILFVGNRSGYKNFGFFIQSISPLLLNENDLNVVCIGGGQFSEQEKSLFKLLGIFDQLKFVSFSEERLQWLYENALSFVFPSLYEGFGMPILEAFSNNCPVAVSNCSCFPEIAGDAALYFEPDNRDSILDVVSSLVYNSSIRESFKVKGAKRVEQFSWKKAAVETVNVYKNVLDQYLQ